MFLFRIGSQNRGSNSPAWGSGLLFNGILCILFGLAVIAAPELLAYIVAVVLIIVGSTMVAAGWKMREAAKR